MKPQQRLILVSFLVFCLFPTPVFAQDRQVYQDDFMRVVATKDVSRVLGSEILICARVMTGPPVSLVAVDLVLKDFFDDLLAEPEVLLFWKEGPKAFCNNWIVSGDVRKWEIGSVMALKCEGGRLSVMHSSNPPQAIPAGKVERIYQDIRNLPGFRDC
jgi:hypothetical protein